MYYLISWNNFACLTVASLCGCVHLLYLEWEGILLKITLSMKLQRLLSADLKKKNLTQSFQLKEKKRLLTHEWLVLMSQDATPDENNMETTIISDGSCSTYLYAQSRWKNVFINTGCCTVFPEEDLKTTVQPSSQQARGAGPSFPFQLSATQWEPQLALIWASPQQPTHFRKNWAHWTFQAFRLKCYPV